MSFVRRFRIYVRKTLYFERRMAKLGPAYSGCPVDCTGPRANPKMGCPNCEYTIQRKGFEREVQREIALGSPGPEAETDWPLPILHDNLNTVSRAHTRARKGYDPKWSVVTARLVEVYRDELARMESIDSWERSQRVEAELERARSRSGSRPRDEDEGD